MSKELMKNQIKNKFRLEERQYTNEGKTTLGLRLREVGILQMQLAGQGGLIRCTHTHGVPSGWPNQEAPTPQNGVMASCEYTPEQMAVIHSAFRAVARH
jgi:hypothetical protein